MFCFLDSSDNVVANLITSLFLLETSYTKLFQVQNIACLRNVLDVT